MKKIFKLLLFFLCTFYHVLFYSYEVLTKEIKYEMRGAILSLDEFDFYLDEFDLVKFKNYITTSYDEFKNNGFNTVFIDLSKFIDLHITEKFNNREENMLNFIVKEGLKRCLDIHASFFDFSLKNIENENIEAYLTALPEKSFIKNNREWIVKFNDKYYLDPGVREVRDYFINLIVNLSNKFKFDGVYLNDTIYPENINRYVFNDSYSYAKYNEDKLSKDSWRRQNINDFMKILGEKFKSYKNELKFGVGVNYIWRTIHNDSNGLNYDGYSDYDRGSFDSLNISKMGYVNYIVVKIDDSIVEEDNIKDIISWWEKKLRIHLVDVFVQGNKNILNILNEVRDNFFINGFVLKEFENNNEIKHLLSEKALIPRFKSFDSYYTATNVEVTPKIVGENIEFSVLDEGFENTKSFVVYKFPYDDLDFENGKYIEDILPSGGKLTKLNVKKDNGVYAVTKLNYNSIESKIVSAFILNDDFGLIEEKFLVDKPRVVNDEIQFMVNSYRKNNEIKFLLERDGEFLLESEFGNENLYSFIPEKEGIYKLNVFISKDKDRENILKSYLNFEVKNEYVVVLDAGHGGEELGAKSFDGILEKDINLSICNYISELLGNVEKVKVKNTRVNDIKIDLSDRVKLCSFLGGDIFLSIHQNAFDNEKVNGIETYYYLKENFSKELCEFIQKNLISETNAFDRGIKNSNFVVLRENIVPSTLIECGFITNNEELKNLINEEYQKNISQAIFKSIISFLDIKDI